MVRMVVSNFWWKYLAIILIKKEKLLTSFTVHIHQLRIEIQIALSNKEIALAISLNIEGDAKTLSRPNNQNVD